MSDPESFCTFEHPLDVIAKALSTAEQDTPCALAIVTQTEGGAVRAPGALMAIISEGESYGYVSGGCIDADVRLNGVNALKTGEPGKIRYGIGSKFQDIQLPCGGAIDLQIIARPNVDMLRKISQQLLARRDAPVWVDETGQLRLSAPGITPLAIYRPRLKVRIAGRGADCLALARLAVISDFDVELCLVDALDLVAARQAGFGTVFHLTSPADLPALSDDAATAFVLMFHDDGWETALLEQALSGPAFYIGAVGSRKTHARRCQKLAESGLTEQAIARVHGPIGLVPSLRDASMLAVSTLAEIIAAFQAESAPR